MLAYRAQLGRLGSRWGWGFEIKFHARQLFMRLRRFASFHLPLSYPSAVIQTCVLCTSLLRWA